MRKIWDTVVRYSAAVFDKTSSCGARVHIVDHLTGGSVFLPISQMDSLCEAWERFKTERELKSFTEEELERWVEGIEEAVVDSVFCRSCILFRSEGCDLQWSASPPAPNDVHPECFCKWGLK